MASPVSASSIFSSWTGIGLDLVRLSGLKWLSMYAPPFLIAVMQEPDPSLAYALWGLAFITLWNYGLTLLNRMVDVEIDSINEPRRPRLIAAIGPHRVYVGGALGLLALLPLALVGLVLNVAAFSVLISWLIFAVISLAYNLGPRYKTSTGLAVFAMSAAVSILFGLGTVRTDLSFDRWFDAIALFAFGSSLLLLGAKDLTDVAGDAADGFSAAFLTLHRSPRLAVFGVATGTMIAFTFVQAISGSAGLSSVVGLFVIACLSGVVATIMVGAATDVEKIGAREVALIAYLSGGCLIPILHQPEARLFALWIFWVLFYCLVDRQLNSDEPSVRLRNLVSLPGSFARGVEMVAR